MNKIRFFLLASTIGLTFSTQAAHADTATAAQNPFQKLVEQAQKAFETAQYKRAEQTWLKAVKSCDDEGKKDADLALGLKRLGETYAKEQKYTDADATLKRAAQTYQDLGTPDQECNQDLADLAKTYKAVDTTQLGKDASDALKEANVQSMSMLKTDTGNKVQITLPQRYVKKIDDSPDVDQVGLEKLVTFDIEEQPDGTVKISNIKGMKVHAKLWVNVDQSAFKKNEQGERVADVTASKMGISKTVTAKLPTEAFEPIDGLVKQLRDFTSPGATMTATTAPTTPAATDTASSATTTPGTTTTAASPVTDSTQTIKPVNYEPSVTLPPKNASPSNSSD
jgi:hypothetical protein